MISRGECFEFRDPIHGMIGINELEREIINTCTFQRLRNIRQLGTTYLVYHGAEHSRFGHCLGVMHIAGKALDILRQREPLKSKLKNDDEYNRVKYTLRLAALLHDVGHAPFSHSGEDLFPSITDVDGSKGTGHEVFTRLIIKEKLSAIIDSYYDQTGVRTVDVLSLLKGVTRDNNYRFAYDIISGQLDADKMDYLLRDSHYCGVNYGLYDLDKILNSLCICESNFGDWQLGIMSDGIYSAEEFIFARYWMFLQVYFHKTRRIYDYYLRKFLQQNFIKYPNNVNEYLQLDDTSVLAKIKELKNQDIWAGHLYYRHHIKEAFLSRGAQFADKNEFDRIAWTIERFKENYNYSENDNSDEFYVDQANGSTAKDLIQVPHYLGEVEEINEENALPAIPVKDKHTNKVKKIQDYSIPLSGISNKKINVLRIYATETKINEVKKFCNENYKEGYDAYLQEKAENKKKLQEMEFETNRLKKEVEKTESEQSKRAAIYNYDDK